MKDTDSDTKFASVVQRSRETWQESLVAALEGHASKPQQYMTMYIVLCSKLFFDMITTNLSVAEEICLDKYEGLQVVSFLNLQDGAAEVGG